MSGGVVITVGGCFAREGYIAADNIHCAEVAAVFTTRNGGVSGLLPGTGHYKSMNLQIGDSGDSYDNIKENYRIAASSLGFSADDVVSVRQKHTDIVLTADEAAGGAFEADALITDAKGILLSVRTADCVPVLMYDRVKGAVAAVHSGWRGTFTRIGVKTLERMISLYGTDPSDVSAAIGPAIGGCCYEIDTDFHERFREEYGGFIDDFFQTVNGGKQHCFLSSMNRAFLERAGIPCENITVSELCTMCNPGLFYSHRRSGFKRGTMAAFIGMRN